MCECHLGQIPLSIVHQGYRISKKCQGESLVHFVSQLPLNSPPPPKKKCTASVNYRCYWGGLRPVDGGLLLGCKRSAVMLGKYVHMQDCFREYYIHNAEPAVPLLIPGDVHVYLLLELRYA